MLSRFAGNFIFNWIPACAGMTRFFANGLFGLKTMNDIHPMGEQTLPDKLRFFRVFRGFDLRFLS